MDQKEIMLPQDESQNTWRVDRNILFESAKEIYPEPSESYYKSDRAANQIEWIINHPVFPNYLNITQELGDFANQHPSFIKKYEDSKNPQKMVDGTLFSDPLYFKYLKLITDQMTTKYQIAQEKPEYQVFSMLEVAKVYSQKAKIVFV